MGEYRKIAEKIDDMAETSSVNGLLDDIELDVSNILNNLSEYRNWELVSIETNLDALWDDLKSLQAKIK